MAISTYTELLAASANWLARSDLTSRIPEFVTLAQARINRQIRAQAMETKTTSFSITGEYVNVPADFLEAKHFYIPGSPRRTLKREDAEAMDEYSSSDTPASFAVVGTQFRFAPAPSSTETATLIYYAKPATLAATTQETNSLFPTNVDLYLYATLLEAESFIQDDPRLAVWKSAYDEAVAYINGQAKKQAAMGGSMTTRAG
jgi:hypothetical protein